MRERERERERENKLTPCLLEQTAINAKFFLRAQISLSFTDVSSLSRGHSMAEFFFIFSKQAWQKVWPHCSNRGTDRNLSLYLQKHTGQSPAFYKRNNIALDKALFSTKKYLYLSSCFFKKAMGILLMPPSVCPSCYLLLNHWVELNKTCYMYITWIYGKGVQEQHYFSMCPLIRVSVIHPFVCHTTPKPLGRTPPNLLHHFPSWLGYARATLFFHVSVCLCRRLLSICLSHYLLNHWAEFNQTCYITSRHG